MKKMAFLIWILAVVSVLAFPKYVVVGIQKDDLDAATRTKLKTGLRSLLKTSETLDNDPWKYYQEGSLAADTNTVVYYAVFYTKHFCAKWLGRTGARRLSNAHFQMWWDANKAKLQARRNAITGSVDKASFILQTGDDWKEVLTDNGVLPAEQ